MTCFTVGRLFQQICTSELHDKLYPMILNDNHSYLCYFKSHQLQSSPCTTFMWLEVHRSLYYTGIPRSWGQVAAAKWQQNSATFRSQQCKWDSRITPLNLALLSLVHSVGQIRSCTTLVWLWCDLRSIHHNITQTLLQVMQSFAILRSHKRKRGLIQRCYQLISFGYFHTWVTFHAALDLRVTWKVVPRDFLSYLCNFTHVHIALNWHVKLAPIDCNGTVQIGATPQFPKVVPALLWATSGGNVSPPNFLRWV